MFACVLLRCGDKQEDATALLAERASVNVRVVSTVGKGTALLEYVVDEDRDLVLCIPNTISNKNGCSQEIKVTGCYFDIENEGRTTLQIAKPDEYYLEKAKNIPTLTAVRKGLTNSISPNDTMIYLGCFKPKSRLSIQVEFLLRLPLKNSPCHILDNSLISKKLLYFLSYASHTKIKDVIHTGSVFEQFDWKFKDSAQQMITVQYATVNDTHEVDELPSISISLSAEAVTQSACCVCLNNDFSASDRTGEETRSAGSRQDNPDGIIIASSRVTPSQLATALSEDAKNGGEFLSGCTTSNPISPSEFVFLVDCSVSMSAYIEVVLSTLITCLKSLPEGCYFNLVPFGTSFRHLFSKSMEYTRANVQQAMDYAYLLKAGLGGTELLPPLQWVFKNARKTDIPCQIFIITDVDQEVKDVPYILNTIRKNRHYARCHTFGVGPNICRSLVVGIAEAGRGRCVLLQEGDRLQAKVMEVLHENLSPALMESKVHFHAPPGYSIVDSTPESLGVAFPHQNQSSFALLQRDYEATPSMQTNGYGGNHGNDISEPALLRGSLVGGAEVQLPIPEADMPRLNSEQLQELMHLLAKMAQWSKMEELEISRLKASSRKSSKAEDEEELADDCGGRGGEPKAKRQRMNGDRSVSIPSPSASELKEDLIRFSLDSQLLCPFTYLKGVGQSDRTVIQILPLQLHQNYQKLGAARNSTSKRPRNGIVSHARRPGDSRRHSHSHRVSSDGSSSSAFSMTHSLSELGNMLKSYASSLFHTSPPASVEFDDCNTLEDEVEIQKMRNTQLSWKSHGKEKLRYPQSYYVSNASAVAVASSSKSSRYRVHGNKVSVNVPQMNGCNSEMVYTDPGHSLPHSVAAASAITNSGPSVGSTSHLSCAISNGRLLPVSSSLVPSHCGRLNSAAADNSSTSDDEDDEISDSESDSSVTLASLPKARNHSHIIQMQLFNGAWPFENQFAYATLVPLSDIKPLPLTEEESSKWLNKPKQKRTGQNGLVPDDESASHFWCTALAVVCLRDCFPEHEVEWKLIVAKGVEWIRQNLDKCGMKLDEVYLTAHNMLFKNNA